MQTGLIRDESGADVQPSKQHRWHRTGDESAKNGNTVAMGGCDPCRRRNGYPDNIAVAGVGGGSIGDDHRGIATATLSKPVMRKVNKNVGKVPVGIGVNVRRARSGCHLLPSSLQEV